MEESKQESVAEQRPLPPDRPGETVYHYSRARRLERAPQAVRNLYNGEAKRPERFRTLKRLAGSKGNIFTLLCLVVVVGMATYSMNRPDNGVKSTKFLDNTVLVKVVNFPGEKPEDAGQSYVQLTKKVDGKKAYQGPVDIAFSPLADEKTAGNLETLPIISNQMFWTVEESQEFRFALPFSAEKLLVYLQTKENKTNLTLSAD
ncbi:MAG: hypothetical protein LBM77_01825 [Spirochaetaceae bacterium]|jgi:hypothetical protein|nr:hypothetical protein [Spirochaetaceae bacterium]